MHEVGDVATFGAGHSRPMWGQTQHPAQKANPRVLRIEANDAS